MTSITARIRDWFGRHSFVRTAVIFILVFLCAFEFDAILRGLRDTYIAKDVAVHHGQVVRMNQITTPSEIQPWMTFQYVNFIFKLPPSYLEDTLKLEDPRYPNVQIQRYMRTHDLDLQIFLGQVQQAVSRYSPTPTSTPQ